MKQILVLLLYLIITCLWVFFVLTFTLLFKKTFNFISSSIKFVFKNNKILYSMLFLEYVILDNKWNNSIFLMKFVFEWNEKWIPQQNKVRNKISLILWKYPIKKSVSRLQPMSQSISLESRLVLALWNDSDSFLGNPLSFDNTHNRNFVN